MRAKLKHYEANLLTLETYSSVLVVPARGVLFPPPLFLSLSVGARIATNQPVCVARFIH